MSILQNHGSSHQSQVNSKQNIDYYLKNQGFRLKTYIFQTSIWFKLYLGKVEIRVVRRRFLASNANPKPNLSLIFKRFLGIKYTF